MQIKKIEQMDDAPFTALLYCAPGVGKSTAIGLIAESSKKNTLVLDVDRTISRTLAKGEVVKDTSRVLVAEVENRGKNAEAGISGTFDSWKNLLKNEITPQFLQENNIGTVAVDNISELERCILADLGSQGKNKGVPAMADYQYMQFQLVNSLRLMKSWGINIVWTAWESVEPFTYPDGTQYNRCVPKITPSLTVSTVPTSSNFSALEIPFSWSSRTWDTSLGLILSDIVYSFLLIYLFTFSRL